VAWFYTVLLALCSAGILGYALLLTRRLFRDEAADAAPRRGATSSAAATRGTAPAAPAEVPTTTGEARA
jgi:hypothetical protein